MKAYEEFTDTVGFSCFVFTHLSLKIYEDENE